MSLNSLQAMQETVDQVMEEHQFLQKQQQYLVDELVSVISSTAIVTGQPEPKMGEIRQGIKQRLKEKLKFVPYYFPEK